MDCFFEKRSAGCPSPAELSTCELPKKFPFAEDEIVRAKSPARVWGGIQIFMKRDELDRDEHSNPETKPESLCELQKTPISSDPQATIETQLQAVDYAKAQPLRDHYAKVLTEPVPEKLMSLVKQLRKASE